MTNSRRIIEWVYTGTATVIWITNYTIANEQHFPLVIRATMFVGLIFAALAISSQYSDLQRSTTLFLIGSSVTASAVYHSEDERIFDILIGLLCLIMYAVHILKPAIITRRR